MRSALIFVGVVLIGIGLLWPWITKIPFGRLPGDIVIDRPNLKFYFPVTTMIVISIIVSVIMRIFRK